MATRTSVGSGLWSAAGTWNTGVPVDGDAFVISAGHTVTFDVDQSAMPTGMAAGTITGTLQASTTAGAYLLKMSGFMTGTGILLAGTSEAVPYPATCTFTVLWSAAPSSPGIQVGTVALYAGCPTRRWIRLTSGYAPGATTLAVDTDVSGDPQWAGAAVVLADVISPIPDVEEKTIAGGGITPTTITLTAGLTVGKSAGSIVALARRNVRLVGATTGGSAYALGVSTAKIGAEISTWARVFTSGIGSDFLESGIAHTISTFFAVSSVQLRVAGLALGGGNTMVYCHAPLVSRTGLLAGTPAPFSQCSQVTILGTVSGVAQALLYSDGYLYGATVDYVSSGVAVYSDSVRMRSSTVPAGAIVLISSFQRPSTYIESADHNGAAGAFFARTTGGSVTDTVVVVPTGRPRSYQHACASATYPCWHQREITVDAGRQLRARVWLRHEAGVAVVAQLVLPTDDPLLDSAATAEDTFDASALSADEWHEHILTWTNSATYPQQILLRFLATAASGYAYSDFEWAFDRTPRGRHGIA